MQATSTLNRKDLINTFLLVVGYGAVFYGLQFFLYRTGLFAHYPDADNLVSWDANWYQSIARHGYGYSDRGQSNSGFFYLFAAIWGITGLDGLGISCLNLLFFAAAFSVLAGMFRLNLKEKMLWLSMPAVFFAFIPYAEALFFLLATLCLLGIREQRKWLIMVSLFLLSLTRATAIFVIPAFLCMELAGSARKDLLKSLVRYLWLYVLPSLAGLGAFVLIQYRATGMWFAYFIAQATFWRRVYTVPVLPFYNGVGNHTLWLNSLAMFVCLTAFILLLVVMVRWLAKDRQADKVLVVSLGYLTMTLFSALFYSPLWNYNRTDIIGNFRYVMMTPFFYVLVNHFTRELQYKWYHYVLVFVYASGAWMAFGAYEHILQFLFFTFNTVIVLFYMGTSSKKVEWPAIALIAINVFFQLHLFQFFISRITLVD